MTPQYEDQGRRRVMCATFTLDIDTCICILYLASMKLLVHLTEAEWFEFDQICGYF